MSAGVVASIADRMVHPVVALEYMGPPRVDPPTLVELEQLLRPIQLRSSARFRDRSLIPVKTAGVGARARPRKNSGVLCVGLRMSRRDFGRLVI